MRGFCQTRLESTRRRFSIAVRTLKSVVAFVIVHLYSPMTNDKCPMTNQYCPNVDRLVSCILLNLIELTPMRFGIDFNLLWQTKATYLRAREPERVVARL